jgi:transcriptional regulator with XRE-family HTH domain
MAPRARGIGKSVHSPEHAAFCDLMIQARKKAGLTQHEVANRLKKPQSFVAKYEGGERRIDVVEFLAIARAIGADPTKIVRALWAGGLNPAPPTRPKVIRIRRKEP